MRSYGRFADSGNIAADHRGRRLFDSALFICRRAHEPDFNATVDGSRGTHRNGVTGRILFLALIKLVRQTQRIDMLGDALIWLGYIAAFIWLARKGARA